MKRLSAFAGSCAAIALLALAGAPAGSATGPTEWKAWGGDAAVTHFSALDQINTGNVARLKPVWIYDPGTTGRGWENTPLLIDGILYVSDAGSGDVVALEPETGKPIWRSKGPVGAARVRGLTYWAGDGTMKPRIILLRAGKMFAIDIKTGQPVTDWPAEGFSVTLPSTAQTQSGRGQLGTNSSPALIYKNYIILSNSSGFRRLPGIPGDPRAYDLRTGKLVWHTRLIPGPGEPGSDSWGPASQTMTGGGSWGILSLDEKTGTIFVPTDSAGPDYVGLWRPGDNKWSDSTVAIDAETGKIKWGFQTHHHDLFDYDSMAAPAVTEIRRNGKTIPVVVQTTKPGMMWILNARTGQPVYGYQERPVAQSRIPGEHSSPTQPFTLSPPPLGRMGITRDQLSDRSPESNAQCKAIWDQNNLQNAGPFTPPFLDATTVYLPGSSGAISWGGATIDPDLGYAFTNVTNIPVINKFGKSPTPDAEGNQGYHTIGNFTRFADSFGRPCLDGRIGEMVAVNLATGKIAWRVPLGDLSDEYGETGKASGAPNIGPSIATRGGLVFIGATADETFRAFDARTGKVLWQSKMSASGVAGPMTYMGKDGRQYVVIAAGGPGTAQYLTKPQWGYRQTLVAFALPRPGEASPDIVTSYPKRMPKEGEFWIPQ